MDANIFLEHIWMYVIFAAIFTLSMFSMRMYNVTTFNYMDRVIKRTVLSVAAAAMCLSMIVFMAKMTWISRLLFVIFCAITCMAVVCGRILMRVCKIKHVGNGYVRVLFIGDEATLERYTNFIEKTSIQIKIARYIKYDNESLNTKESFAKLLMDTQIEEVQFVHTLNGGNLDIKRYLDICDSMGVTTRIILDSFDLSISKRYVHSIGTYPVITYHSVSLDKFQLFIKSVIDVVGAAVGVLLLAPVFITTAIAIKLDSPGPVIFKQKRVGAHGKEFFIYKFRSMCADADNKKRELMDQNNHKDGYMFKIADDPRITRVGRFIRRSSIDELPQLINVLKRDMSLVGTRPPTLDEVEKYNPDHWRRISIQPGITGMWQVNGRNRIMDFEDVVKLDKKYIDEWSVLLDIKLLIKTVKAVLSASGAY